MKYAENKRDHKQDKGKGYIAAAIKVRKPRAKEEQSSDCSSGNVRWIMIEPRSGKRKTSISLPMILMKVLFTKTSCLKTKISGSKTINKFNAEAQRRNDAEKVVSAKFYLIDLL